MLTETTPLLEVRNLHVRYGSPKRPVRAVDGVSLKVRRGEVLGVVGESGSGKSTLGRAVLRLLPAEARSEGSVVFDGSDLSLQDATGLRHLRERMQLIFQDPIASLNPLRSVDSIVEEPLRILGLPSSERKERVKQMLHLVGMEFDAVQGRRPHEFSGGQCQRISIARTLVLKPELVVCDEAVSALDVSVRAQIINLLLDLKRDLGLTLLFIAHDLNIVRAISDRIAVMYLGRIVELGDTEAVFSRPSHPYTRALLAAIPQAEPGAAPPEPLPGETPSPAQPPSGCHFRTRCPAAQARCGTNAPWLRWTGRGQQSACHFPLNPS